MYESIYYYFETNIKKTCAIEGEKPTDKSVIYAAE